MRIEGSPAIVTGGASGLGRATAALLAEHGAPLALFDLDEGAGAEAAGAGGGSYHNVNVADDAAVEAAVAAAEAQHGPARILVNCAGVAPSIRTVGRDNVPHPLEAFRRAVEINLVGTFNVIARVCARMIAGAEPLGEERGVVVNTASVAAFDGQVGQAAYAASKGGVVGMTLPIARDLAQHRIRVVAVAPGLFLTPMLKGLPQGVQDSLGQQAPHPNRLGRPEEFAQFVASIVENPMLNGEVIRLDGAIRMGPR